MSLDAGATTMQLGGELSGRGWPTARDARSLPAAPRPGGNAAAEFEKEAVPHLRSLFAAGYRLTRNAGDAEDLVQETCLRAYRAWATYTPGTNIRAWLFTILYRARTDALRRKGRTLDTVELEGEGPAVPPPQDAFASGHENLTRALNALPELFRTAVILRDVEERSYDEIASALKIPIGTVMSRIHRGRAQLRRALGGESGSAANAHDV